MIANCNILHNICVGVTSNELRWLFYFILFLPIHLNKIMYVTFNKVLFFISILRSISSIMKNMVLKECRYYYQIKVSIENFSTVRTTIYI